MSTEETTVDGVPSDEWPEDLVRFADADLRNLDEARAEAEALRQELDDTKTDLARMVDQLAEANARRIKACDQRDTWRTMHHEVEADRNIALDALNAHLPLKAEVERLRTAIKHVADLATQGNTVGLIAAAARLGEVLDGGT